MWVHGFNIAELGRGDSYGIYDIANSLGWVNVGIDHDTSTFAVGGGSNGYRVRLWKLKLQDLARETIDQS